MTVSLRIRIPTLISPFHLHIRSIRSSALVFAAESDWAPDLSQAESPSQPLAGWILSVPFSFRAELVDGWMEGFFPFSKDGLSCILIINSLLIIDYSFFPCPVASNPPRHLQRKILQAFKPSSFKRRVTALLSSSGHTPLRRLSLSG